MSLFGRKSTRHVKTVAITMLLLRPFLPFPVNDEFPHINADSLDEAKAKVKAWYDYVILAGLGLAADKPEFN